MNFRMYKVAGVSIASSVPHRLHPRAETLPRAEMARVIMRRRDNLKSLGCSPYRFDVSSESMHAQNPYGVHVEVKRYIGRIRFAIDRAHFQNTPNTFFLF